MSCPRDISDKGYGVLESTFIHIPGVGPITEQKIWDEDIYTWDDYLDKTGLSVSGISKIKDDRIRKWLIISKNALRNQNIHFFINHLHKRDWWRLYPNFKEHTAFLDIETTGLSHYYDYITIIGLFDGKKQEVFIQGQNLEDFNNKIEGYKLLVTFNGTLFDLPFINSKIEDVGLPPAHIDLRYLLRRLGYKGGLKAVEKQVGLSRSNGVEETNGFGATVLWNRYERGDDDALEPLIKYNYADTVNLKKLIEFAYEKLVDMEYPIKYNIHFDDYYPSKIHVYRLDDSMMKLVIDDNSVITINPENNRNNRVHIDTLLHTLVRPYGYPRIVGIDLSGSEKRKTGWSMLEGRKAYTEMVKTDEEIISKTIEVKPDLISIDSPLSLPLGRDCTRDDCECRKHGITRECERILWKRGVNVYPCLIPSMQGLTARGIMLRDKFEKLGYKVIESYPGAAQDILKIIRKRISVDDLKQGLIDFGLELDFASQKGTHDEMDAVTSALVGYFYISGNYEALGNEEEDYLIIPKREFL